MRIVVVLDVIGDKRDIKKEGRELERNLIGAIQQEAERWEEVFPVDIKVSGARID